MAVTKSDLLYYNDLRTGRIAPKVGGGTPTLTRGGDRRAFDGNLYRKLTEDIPGIDVSEAGRRQLALALADTPVTDDSVDFSSTSAWTRTNIASEAAASSIISDLPSGGEARELVGSGVGTARLEQPLNGSTGAKELGAMVVEDNGDAGRVAVLALDDTGTYIDAIYDFSTDSLIENVGSGTAITLAENGPNGGKTILLIGIGTGNNTTGRNIRPTFDRNATGDGAIVHYAAHHELGVFPGINPYVGSPSASAADQVYVSPGPYRSDTAQVAYISAVVYSDGGAEDRPMVLQDAGNPSDPTAPSQVGTVSSVDLDGAFGVDVVGNYAYVAARFSDALTVIDISDPTSPLQVGTVSSTDLDGARNVDVVGNYAYVAARLSGALTVIDISDPTTPLQVGTVSSVDLDGARNVDVVGNYAYVAANLPDALTVVDISDPTAPTQVGTVSSVDLDGAFSVDVVGDYAYVAANAADALTVIALRDAAHASITLAGDARASYTDASGRGAPSMVSPSIHPGSLVEAVMGIRPSDGTTRLLVRIDGGSWQDGGAVTPSAWATPADLGADNRITYNESGTLTGFGRGAMKVRRHHVVDGSALTNNPFTAGANAVGDEVAGVYYSPATDEVLNV